MIQYRDSAQRAADHQRQLRAEASDRRLRTKSWLRRWRDQRRAAPLAIDLTSPTADPAYLVSPCSTAGAASSDREATPSLA